MFDSYSAEKLSNLTPEEVEMITEAYKKGYITGAIDEINKKQGEQNEQANTQTPSI